MNRTIAASVIVSASLLGHIACPDCAADGIYVLYHDLSSNNADDIAIDHLTTLGYGFEMGGALTDYSAYKQVWDLRFNNVLTSADAAAFGDYLASGGRMFLMSDSNRFYMDHNHALNSFALAVGAGNMSIPWDYDNNDWGAHYQEVTAPGQVLNTPNEFSSVHFNFSALAHAPGNGFFVTEHQPTGFSSLIGWDFGQITGKESARMLISFDINVFNNVNGPVWTENMYTFLDATAVPEPSSLAALAGLGAAGAGVVRKRRLKRWW